MLEKREKWEKEILDGSKYSIIYPSPVKELQQRYEVRLCSLRQIYIILPIAICSAFIGDCALFSPHMGWESCKLKRSIGVVRTLHLCLYFIYVCMFAASFDPILSAV